MNVIDVLAIMPYYVSLFIMGEEPDPSPSAVTAAPGAGPTLSPDEEEGTTFDDRGRWQSQCGTPPGRIYLLMSP